MLGTRIGTLLLTALALQAIASAQSSNCYTLKPDQPAEVIHAGGLVCLCPGQKPLTIQLGTSVGKMEVTAGGTRMGGGPINCYTTTVIRPATSKAEPGGPVTATQTMLVSTVISRKCNYSECKSILGLFSWGSADCQEYYREYMQDTPSWVPTGECPDTDPPTL